MHRPVSRPTLVTGRESPLQLVNTERVGLAVISTPFSYSPAVEHVLFLKCSPDAGDQKRDRGNTGGRWWDRGLAHTVERGSWKIWVFNQQTVRK